MCLNPDFDQFLNWDTSSTPATPSLVDILLSCADDLPGPNTHTDLYDDDDDDLITYLENFPPDFLLTDLDVVNDENTRRRPLLFDNPSSVICHQSVSSVSDAQKVVARPYQCTVDGCQRFYVKETQLKTHLKRHTGQKPYRCDWGGGECKWRFARSDELQRHRRSHSGYKPYKCHLCQRSFTRSDHLTKHVRVHNRKMALYGTYQIHRRK